MISLGKLFWQVRELSRQMWLRAVAMAVLGVAAALAGVLLAPFVPDGLARRVGTEAVDQILGILASSMLAVTTFSLAIAVQAYASAASSATPRATRLLQQDRTTQNVLATFIGAFLFGLVGIIALQAGLYQAAGRVVLFAAAVLVVVLVVIALLRWVGHLTQFGRVGDTLDRVEAAALAAIEGRAREPCLGARARQGTLPSDAVAVYPRQVGYIQHVDVAALQELALEMDAEFWLADLPGSFVHPADPLLHVVGASVDESGMQRLRAAFSVQAERSFEQDPRFGLIVLAEIASRALSPAVNDPGTAIAVIGRLLRVLLQWRPHDPGSGEHTHPRLYVPALDPSDLLTDAFAPIARDGAGIVEVQIRLHKALAALAQAAPEQFGSAVAAFAAVARERAEAALVVASDRRRLQQELQHIATAAPAVPDRA